jgi:hypothetical protein
MRRAAICPRPGLEKLVTDTGCECDVAQFIMMAQRTGRRGALNSRAETMPEPMQDVR